MEDKNQSSDGLTLVLMRNDFYRDKYRHAVLSVAIIFIIDIFLTIAVVHQFLNPPNPQYFPTNSQYQLIKWHPLSDPVVDNNYVLQWVADAVKQAFSLDFIHWRDQLQKASDNFTPSGWYWFLSAFKQSGNLDTLVKLQMVSNVTVTGAPVVQYQNVLDGRYIWKIQLPVLISYTNLQRTINQPLKITLIVERVSLDENPYRIAINQFLPVAETGVANT